MSSYSRGTQRAYFYILTLSFKHDKQWIKKNIYIYIKQLDFVGEVFVFFLSFSNICFVLSLSMGL